MNTMQMAAAAPIKLENARQLVINENSYVSRVVGDWSAHLRSDMLGRDFTVAFYYKGNELANHVFGQLQSAVDFLNSHVKEVVNNRLEDEARRA